MSLACDKSHWHETNFKKYLVENGKIGILSIMKTIRTPKPRVDTTNTDNLPTFAERVLIQSNGDLSDHAFRYYIRAMAEMEIERVENAAKRAAK